MEMDWIQRLIKKEHNDSLVQAGREAGQCVALRGLDGIGLPLEVIKTWSDHYGQYPEGTF